MSSLKTSERLGVPRPSSDWDDQQRAMGLAELAISGDLPATQRLIALVRPAITRLAAAVLGAGYPDVEDVVQQSLIAFGVTATQRDMPAGSPSGKRCELDTAASSKRSNVRSWNASRRPIQRSTLPVLATRLSAGGK